MSRTLTLFIIVLFGITAAFANYADHRDRTSVKVSESDNFYEVQAQFNESKTKKVASYMNDNLEGRKDFSFSNTQLDATITLDDKTTFYIKFYPGKLTLKFDKRKNTNSAYAAFKKMGDGVKNVIGN